MMYRRKSTTRSLLLCAVACTLTAVQATAALIDLTPVSPAANSVGSVSLADLQNGQVEGITVGDKIFDGFSYSRIGDMPAAADVRVLGFRDINGNWGISLHGAFVDLPGGSFSDALVRFNVSVHPFQAQQGWRITDAHLAMGGVGMGPNSFFGVDESFTPLSNATLSVERSTIGPGNTKLTDDVLFTNPGFITLPVVKDIFAIAADGQASPARATVIDQSFSQTLIPEPATAAMSLVGALALLGRKRRQS